MTGASTPPGILAQPRAAARTLPADARSAEAPPTGALRAGALPPTVVDDRQTTAMETLADALDALGYRQLYAQALGPTLFTADRSAALDALDAWPAPERHALRLLALHAPADATSMPGELVAAVGALEAAGLLSIEGDLVHAADWVVVPALGGHLMTCPPPGYLAPGAGRARAYLGPDSLRLAAALPPARGRRVLDVGTGCGIQGLLAVAGAAEAVLVDIEPASVQMAARNRVLNRVPHPARIVTGDVYSPVAGERFDLIVALPPYVPTVPQAAQSGVTAGGEDGLALLRRLIAGATDHLAPGGELVAMSQLLCCDDEPLLAAELPSLAPDLDVRLVASDWHPLQPYLVELVTGLAAAGAVADVAVVLDHYRRSLRAMAVTGVCTAIVRLRTPRGPAPGGSVRVVGRRTVRADDVLAPAPGLRVAGDPSLRLATVDGSAPVAVEGPTAALLGAFDGRRSVVQAAVAAWGHLAGADALDVADQAVRRTEQLVRRGLVSRTAAPGSGAR